MEKKAVYGILLTLLITSVLTMASDVESAKAQETVRLYIKDPSDGDNVYLGEPVGTTFSVQVWIDSPSEWYDTLDGIVGYTISVQVDPAILEPVGAAAVPDLDSDGWSDSFLGEFCKYKEWTMGTLEASEIVDKTIGTIAGFAEIILSGTDLGAGAGGSGMLMWFWFKSKSATEYSLIDLIHEGLFNGVNIDARFTNARGETYKADVVEDGHYNWTRARIYIDPPIVYASPGVSFTVDVMIADVVNLYSWQVNMTFNPDVLTFVNVTAGDFLANQPEGTDGPYIAAGTGWAMFCVMTFGAYPGVSGSGTLATVELNVKAIGESVLNITNDMTKLLEINLPPIPPGKQQFELIPYTAENGYFGVSHEIAIVNVFPPTSTALVGETFTVNVTITDVANLYGWQFNLTFNPSVLQVISVVEGPFLSRLDATVWPTPHIDSSAGHVMAMATFMPPLPPHGADGNGTLASVTFQVISFGQTPLTFEKTYTKLLTVVDGSVLPIEHETSDGYFSGGGAAMSPTASFTYSPINPYVGEAVTFDASASYDPDGTIVNYLWSLGDGTTGSGMVITHAYATAGNYSVALTVTDNDALNDTATSTITVLSMPVHDVTVTAISVSPFEVLQGETVTIDVTTENEGDFSETFDVTVYYDSATILTVTVTDLPPGAEKTVVLVWDTSGVSGGTYVIKAAASIVPGEVDTANNVFTNGQVTVIVDTTAPIASFTWTPTEPNVNEAVTFDASASTDNIGIVLYEWNFGDETKATGMIVTHAYAEAGTYNVELMVWDAAGNHGSASATIKVAKKLSVRLSGEFDYMRMEPVNIRLVALVIDAQTMEPVSDALVAVEIYDPAGKLWVSAQMQEKIGGSGIYEWTSAGTIGQLRLSKGVYLVRAGASFQDGPTAYDISLFHIDPPAEDTTSTAPPLLYAVIILVAAGITIGIALLKRHKRQQRTTQ